MSITLIVTLVMVLLALLLVKKSLVIISQSETKIVERLGRYHATLQPGINVIIPSTARRLTCANRCMTSTSRTSSPRTTYR